MPFFLMSYKSGTHSWLPLRAVWFFVALSQQHPAGLAVAMQGLFSVAFC